MKFAFHVQLQALEFEKQPWPPTQHDSVLVYGIEIFADSLGRSSGHANQMDVKLQNVTNFVPSSLVLSHSLARSSIDESAESLSRGIFSNSAVGQDRIDIVSNDTARGSGWVSARISDRTSFKTKQHPLSDPIESRTWRSARRSPSGTQTRTNSGVSERLHSRRSTQHTIPNR
jgi:hypothetical protein